MDRQTQPDEPADPRTSLWHRRGVRIAVAVATIALACVVIEQSLRSDGQPKDVSSSHGAAPSGDHMASPAAQGARVGEVVPAFFLSTPSGSNLAVPAGKPTAIGFTADGCRSCIPNAGEAP